MKKTGFTLVELLGVLTLMALLALIIVPAVLKSQSKGNQKLYEAQLQVFILEAKDWAIDNPSSLPATDGATIKVTIQTLADEGYLDAIKLIDPRTSKKFPENFGVTITRISRGNYEYIVDNN